MIIQVTRFKVNVFNGKIYKDSLYVKSYEEARKYLKTANGFGATIKEIPLR